MHSHHLHQPKLTILTCGPNYSSQSSSLSMAMAQGSGSAGQKASVYLLAMVLCIMLFASSGTQAATYVVGGPAGWTFNTNSWPNGKRFRAGDVLIFNYDPKMHNVVLVDRAGYSRCTTPRGARVLQSGKDKIKLGKGQNYFICSIPGHCDSGMKIAITAA
uniref:Basic blue protein n=1 Tax=Kalanchoe fedtschenkoi TaxID=63787 RepID=A0A7N0UUI2_KALFE